MSSIIASDLTDGTDTVDLSIALPSQLILRFYGSTSSDRSFDQTTWNISSITHDSTARLFFNFTNAAADQYYSCEAEGSSADRPFTQLNASSSAQTTQFRGRMWDIGSNVEIAGGGLLLIFGEWAE